MTYKNGYLGCFYFLLVYVRGALTVIKKHIKFFGMFVLLMLMPLTASAQLPLDLNLSIGYQAANYYSVSRDIYATIDDLYADVLDGDYLIDDEIDQLTNQLNEYWAVNAGFQMTYDVVQEVYSQQGRMSAYDPFFLATCNDYIFDILSDLIHSARYMVYVEALGGVRGADQIQEFLLHAEVSKGLLSDCRNIFDVRAGDGAFIITSVLAPGFPQAFNSEMPAPIEFNLSHESPGITGTPYLSSSAGEYILSGSINQRASYTHSTSGWSLYARSNKSWHIDFNEIGDEYSGTIASSSHTHIHPWVGQWSSGLVASPVSTVYLYSQAVPDGEYTLSSAYGGFPVYKNNDSGFILYRKIKTGTWVVSGRDEPNEDWDAGIYSIDNDAVWPWEVTWNPGGNAVSPVKEILAMGPGGLSSTLHFYGSLNGSPRYRSDNHDYLIEKDGSDDHWYFYTRGDGPYYSKTYKSKKKTNLPWQTLWEGGLRVVTNSALGREEAKPHITSIYISESSTCKNGYTRTPSISTLNGDLNQSAGGADIYLCQSTSGSKGAISNFYLSSSDSSPSGYRRVPSVSSLNGDLNESAGGKDIYMHYNRGANGLGIEDLYINSSNNCPGKFESVSHSHDLNGDLNQNAGGKYIYLCMKRSHRYVTDNIKDIVSGEYELEPSQNNWHFGTITHVSGNKYEWQNRAGRKWNLFLDVNRKVFTTDQTNPYYHSGAASNQNHDYFREFKIQFDEGFVSGFSFQGGVYNMQ